MDRIFQFIYRYRSFFTFVVLELVCGWLIIENNQYQGAAFFNSSNTIVGRINSVNEGIRDYFSLKEVNEILALQNTELRKKVEQQNQVLFSLKSAEVPDSVIIKRFDFVPAKVVNNSVNRSTNYITIDKGNDFGIEPGMAVVGTGGAVGKVKVTSSHFSVVSSLLHVDIRISGYMIRTGYFGTIQWDGTNPEIINFEYVPRHVKPIVGDTIVTSGYGGIFPDGIMIGTIHRIELGDGTPFYDLKVKLSQDFRKLTYVSVIKSNLKYELDSLEQQIPEMGR
jgi:rod shape-determining protein MreC